MSGAAVPQPAPVTPEPPGDSRWAMPLLLMVMAGGAALTFAGTAGHNLFADELQILSSYRSWDPGELLKPAGGHLIITSLTAYKTIFEVFGADSYLPNRILHVALALVCAGLFYALVRRRIGPLAAVAPTAILLVLGSAAEIVATPFGVLEYMGVAFGLAMFLCLERGDRAGDIAAMVFLGLGLASYSINIAFGIGAAVLLYLRDPKQPLRYAWVILAPAVLYGIWRLAFSESGETNITITNVADMPSAMFTMLAASCAAITGLFRIPAQGAVTTTEWGYPLAVLLIGLVWLRLARGPRVDSRFWLYAAALVSFWALVSINLGPLREPDAGRYVHISVILLMLVGVELVAGLRMPRWAGPALAGAACVSVLANAVALHEGGDQYRLAGQSLGAQLTGAELAGENADPEIPVLPLPDVPVVQDLMIPVSDYIAAAEDYGSPAYEPENLERAPEVVRAAADSQLVRLLGDRIGPTPIPALPAGCTPIESAPAVGGVAVITVPAGGFSLEAAPGPPVGITLRRFSEGAGLPLRGVPGGSAARIDLPADSASRPWSAVITAQQPVGLCSLSPSPSA